jgi:hypothetical protein
LLRLYVVFWGRGGPMSPRWWDPIMSRVIAVPVCGFMLAACSTTMPSLDFMKSAPQGESLAIESEPPGAEAKKLVGAELSYALSALSPAR